MLEKRRNSEVCHVSAMVFDSLLMFDRLANPKRMA